ncbi:putative cytidine deaminase [Rosa chinensis]|uniref:Putative cytidine deaminase n=1 Tax=Rosa chinensis TaxID=74649 RepID=A0A2P6QRQ4_ROSCH|nr:putative cytidine deaminase [Rosa chinensis]
MAKQKGLTVVQLLPSFVEPSMALARVPISKFPSGALGYLSSGWVFFEVNLEFPSLHLHYFVHAE